MKVTVHTEGRGFQVVISLNPEKEKHTADVLARDGWVQALIENALAHEKKGRPRVMLRLTEEEVQWLRDRGGINPTVTRLIRADSGDNVNVWEPRGYKVDENANVRVEVRDWRAADILGRAVNPQAYCRFLIRKERLIEKMADQEGVI